MHSKRRVITTHRHVATSTLNTTSHHVTVLKSTARSTAMCSLLSLLGRWESMQRVMCRCTRIHLFEGNETIDILPSLLPTLHLLSYHPKSTAHYAATHSTCFPLGRPWITAKGVCRCTTKDRHLGKWRVSGRLNLRLLIFWGVYWCLGFNRNIIQFESITLWEVNYFCLGVIKG